MLTRLKETVSLNLTALNVETPHIIHIIVIVALRIETHLLVAVDVLELLEDHFIEALLYFLDQILSDLVGLLHGLKRPLKSLAKGALAVHYKGRGLSVCHL